MPSFAACLYGSALYTPGPRGVRCFVEEGPNSRTYVGADPPVEPRQRVELGDQDVQDASHHRQPLPADPTQVAAKPGFANGIVQDPPPQIGRRILPVGTSLIAQLHQQRPQNLLHRPLVLSRKLLPPAPDLPLPERPSHPEEPLLDHSHRCLIHLHPKVPGHPLHRQPLGLGAWVAQDAHGLHAFLAEEVGQFRGIDAVGVDEAAIGDLGEAPGEPAATYALRGDYPDGDPLPPPPQEPAGRGEPTAFYEVRTYSHDVLWFAKSQDALESLVNQGKPVAALHEVWSHPS